MDEKGAVVRDIDWTKRIVAPWDLHGHFFCSLQRELLLKTARVKSKD